MPFYIYEHPETGQTKEVFQSMTEKHEYAEDGVPWRRVWNTVQAAQNMQLDPFSQQAFIDKIGSSKGTYGDVIDRSADLSAQRAAKRDGVDPVKEAKYKEYSDRCHGRPHPHMVTETMRNLRDKVLRIGK